MKRATATGQGVLAAFLCVSLAIWSILPSFTHAPAVFETVADHLGMIEDHGHSHGMDEDLLWALHGHSHDVADHDHSQAFLPGGKGSATPPGMQDNRFMAFAVTGPSRHFRRERPPRV